MIINLVIIFFYCVACLGLGLIIFHIIKINRDNISALPYISCAFIFGQAVLANVWILSALRAFFSANYIWSVLFVLCLGATRLLPGYRNDVGLQLKYHYILFRKMNFIFQLLVFLTIFTIILHVCAAHMLHPTIDADGFYLLYPKIISSAERLASFYQWPLPSQLYLLTELHFAALIGLNTISTAKLFMWPISLSIAVILFSLSGHCGLSNIGKWISLVILFTSTAFIFLISDGKTDLTAAALSLSAVYWLISAEQPLSISVLSIAGLLTGFAIAAKNSYLVCFGPPIIMLIIWRTLFEGKEKSVESRMKALVIGLAIIGAGALVALIPNMIKNYSIFNEPLAPFYYFTGERRTFLDQVWHSADVTRNILLMYPLSISFGVHRGQYGNLSPLFLAFIPLLCFLKRPFYFYNRSLIQTVSFGLCGIAMWMVFFPSFHAPRYYLVDLILLVPLAAHVSSIFVSYPKMFPLIHRAILFCLFLSLFFMLMAQYRLVVRNEIGGLNWAAAVSPIEGLHDKAIEKINQFVPYGSRLFLYGSNTVYLRGDLLQCLSSEKEKKDFAAIPFSVDRWSYLFSRGFSYVVIRGNPYIKDPEAERLFDSSEKPDWLNIRACLNKDGVKAYQILSNDSYHKPDLLFKQDHPPAWDIVNAVSK